MLCRGTSLYDMLSAARRRPLPTVRLCWFVLFSLNINNIVHLFLVYASFMIRAKYKSESTNIHAYNPVFFHINNMDILKVIRFMQIGFGITKFSLSEGSAVINWALIENNSVFGIDSN